MTTTEEEPSQETVIAALGDEILRLEADRDRWMWGYTEAVNTAAEREEALLAEIARLKTQASHTSLCTCACHTYPGTYPTSKARPCGVCGHYLGQPTIAGAL